MTVLFLEKMKTLIKNCKLISPGIESENVSIVIEDDKIKTVHDDVKDCAAEKFDKVLDASGLMAVPGFIDIHCHGSSGADVMDCTTEAIEKIAKSLDAALAEKADATFAKMSHKAKSMDELNTFYEINWVHHLPKIIIVDDRKTINYLKEKRQKIGLLVGRMVE